MPPSIFEISNTSGFFKYLQFFLIMNNITECEFVVRTLQNAKLF